MSCVPGGISTSATGYRSQASVTSEGVAVAVIYPNVGRPLSARASGEGSPSREFNYEFVGGDGLQTHKGECRGPSRLGKGFEVGMSCVPCQGTHELILGRGFQVFPET